MNEELKQYEEIFKNEVAIPEGTLPAALRELIDAAAEQVHISWARQRLSEGWRYGEQRNDPEKVTPCMIPFCDLPEEEKMYDRMTAERTLRFLLASGYTVTQISRKGNKDDQKAMEAYFSKIQTKVREDAAKGERHTVYFRPDNRLTLLRKSASLFGFDADLEKAIITFINAENFNNAYQVYKTFFSMFPDSDKLIGYLSSMHDFEEKAATLNNKQRDHFVHSVNVFILGLVIYSNNTRMRELLDGRITNENKSAAFLKMWGVAALMHDIGYPAEIAHNNIIGYFDRLNTDTDRSNNNVHPYIEIGYFDRFNSIRVNHDGAQFSFGTSVYLKPLDLISHRLAEVYGYDCTKPDSENDMDNAVMKNHINGYFPYMHSAGFTDHGFFSAVMVLRQFACMLRDEEVPEAQGLSASSYRNLIIEAATAIFLHNSWRYLQYLQRNGEFYKKGSPMNTGTAEQLSPEQFPLGYLMILCDELQDWNRTAYGKEDKIREKDGFLAESADISKVDDDNLIITYYTKSRAQEKDMAAFRKKKFGSIDKIIDFTAIFKHASADNFADTADIIEIYRKPMLSVLDELRAADPEFMDDAVYSSVAEHLHEKLDQSAKIIFNNYNQLNQSLGYGIDYAEWDTVPLTLQLSNIRQASQIFERLAASGRVIRSGEGTSDAFCEEGVLSEIERLAADEHDSWSCERAASGWTPCLGKKNVENKKTPCFLEFDDLSEELKEYDRAAVRNCIEILEKVYGLHAVKK